MIFSMRRETSVATRRGRLVALFCAVMAISLCLISIADWLTAIASPAHGSHRFIFPLSAWIVYYAAAELARSGHVALIFDPGRFAGYQQSLSRGPGIEPLPFSPWLYPPSYLALLLPFASLPFFLSCAIFEALGLVGAAAALAWREGRVAWRCVLALLAAPAVYATAFAGQNAFLSTGLLLGGMRLVARRPVLAGLLLGLLSYKPQLGLMIPVALVGLRAWRAFFAAAGTVAAMVGVSILLFGFEPWRLWLDLGVAARQGFRAQWFHWGFLQGFSIDVCARLLGAPAILADALQGIAVVLAGAAVYAAHARPIEADARLAVLCAATTLGAPHLGAYDLLPLAAGAILIYPRLLVRGLPLAEAGLLGLAWILPELRPAFFAIGLAAPFVIAAFLVFALRLGWRPQPAPAAIASVGE